MNIIASFIANEFLCGIKPVVHLADGEDISVALTLKEDGNSTMWSGKSDGVELSFTAKQGDNSAIFYADLKSEKPLCGRAVTMEFDISCADAVTASYLLFCMFWHMVNRPKTNADLNDKTQSLIMKKGEEHYSVVGLTGDIFHCDIEGGELSIQIGCDGYTELHGPMLTVAVSDEPINAVEYNYKQARASGAITVPLREEREYPELFEHLGWCSWDTFYQNVTSAGLYQKLDEFKEKHVPIKWIIIDDGWAQTEERYLVDYHADPVKFPEGLGECIRRIKEEYGIEKVGIWHTFNGYWRGVKPDSPLAEKYKDVLITAKGTVDDDGIANNIVPSNDPDVAFSFWNAWHTYLEECGVDFVKVDNQSFTHYYMGNTFSTTAGARAAHEAMERSIAKHFGGVVINCMGMDMENVFARPYTAVSRNSDDFSPAREDGFAHHITQNVYNAIWHSQMYYCDYDMWWSGKAEPVKSGLLRAISGGPVYVSDALGGTDMAGILPVVGEDGDICRLDHAALPTLDCIYTNCREDGHLLKTYNRKGDAVALAVFNISREDVSETFKLGVIPDMEAGREYVAYEYFTKKFTRVNSDAEVTLTLTPNDMRGYSLYPILKDGDGEYIMLGECKRYFGIGSREKTKALIKDLI